MGQGLGFRLDGFRISSKGKPGWKARWPWPCSPQPTPSRPGCRVSDFGFRVWGLRCRVEGLLVRG